MRATIVPSAMIAVLDRDDLGAARGADLHLLGPGVDVAHRAAGLHRAQRRQRLDDHVDLAAEPAAHHAADEPQPVGRELEDDRGVVEAEVDRLGVGVDGEPAVGLGDGDAAGGLDRGVLDRARAVHALDDVVGLGEPGLDVAEPDLALRVALVDERVVAPVGHDRGAGRERLLHVEHGGQLLEVEAHRGGGLDRGRLGLGEDRDDRLAHVADAVDGEDELLLGLDADQAEDRVHVVRHVLVGQRPDEARDPLAPRTGRRRGSGRGGAGCGPSGGGASRGT